MKAFTLDAFDTAPGIRTDLPNPTGERIVRLHASSVNPVDAAIAGGMLRGMADYAFPVVLGRDFAGVVEDTGEEVFGFVPHADPAVGAGAWAERITLSPFFAPKPASLSLTEAGAAPLAGITALLSVEALALTGGERVLILGATGGVGAFAVQLAARAGATVIAPANADDRDYLEALGASEVPERGSAPQADALIDLISYSPEQLAANAPGLRDGAKTVSALGAAEINVMAVSDPEAPARLARAIDEHGLQVPLARSFAFDELGEALGALGTHKRGKISVVA
ncbi:NADP-dependent oxidoreductase [Solirubrobacter phytolaccae]|uniref:NADP-dependent oxidoreductase n=1 Tax=Solirubrobacter phytolaccae TaxID=1404360 RepID=A0A9X3NAI1_9ACTN|nr:NADP-dependent oxidoreductase [Solirubrobacter phytolaccae]MDA0181350.1 NADP-dependent oxidoreductase [Solirubrobacter phytolaccae]